jgi:hypothetical protein
VIQFSDLALLPGTHAATGFCKNLRTKFMTRYAEEQYGDHIVSVTMKSASSCAITFQSNIHESEDSEEALADMSIDIESFPIELDHENGVATSTRCFVAVSLRECREVEKNNVMRLELIGRGAFGEVYRGLLQESHRGVPSCLVAMKMTLSVEVESRDELLQEGALMGAFKHFNIINLIGVVTIPKDMPAILLMEYVSITRCTVRVSFPF